MHMLLYQHSCQESDQKVKFQQKQALLPQKIHSTCVLHLSQATSNTFSLQILDFPKRKLIVLSRRESMSTACTHPRQKLGEELECALSYSTTAPAAPEMGTWNLVKRPVVSNFSMLPQWNEVGGDHCLSHVHLAYSYAVLVPHFMTYIGDLSLFSRGPVKHQILTPATEKACAPVVGQKSAGTQLVSYSQPLSHQDNTCKG